MRILFSKSINLILGILMLLIVILCMCGTGAEYAYKKVFMFSNIVYALLGVICFALIGSIAYKIGVFLEKSKKTSIIMFFFSVLFFLGLVGLTYHYYFKTGWDAQMVEWAAKAIADKDWENIQNRYFSYYPNNVFLTFVFSCVVKLGMLLGVDNYYFCIIIFQCALFAITGYLLYASARWCVDGRIAFAIWMMYVLMIGLSPWVVIPYSDATGLLFPTLLIYIYIRICRGKNSMWWIGCFTFFSYLGYRIKPQIAIVAIAVLLVTFFSVQKDCFLEKKKLLWRVIACASGLVLGMLVVNAGVRATHMNIEKELTFGLPHYIMMGLNEEYGGVINIVDQDFSMRFSTREERNEANLQVAGERLEKLGIGGLLNLWKNKILTNFADGTFAWWQEGNFYSQEMYEGNYQLRSVLTEFYYEGRPGHDWFKNFMQALWMGTLSLSLTSTFIFRKQDGKKELDVLKLSLVGIIIFEMIFEARARYIFIYAPLFMFWAWMSWEKYIKRIGL